MSAAIVAALTVINPGVIGFTSTTSRRACGTFNGNANADTYTFPVIVGFAIDPRKRWRLDFSDKPGALGESPKWVHVNEENFDAPPGSQRIVHRVDSNSFTLVALQY